MNYKYELLKDYMSKCPFIEFYEIAVDLNGEVADIRVAFDSEYCLTHTNGGK
tara:strand:- start:139 stop:294 length:156 start_codon:yes stop_codon:yes gene_type:complete